jgi:hypothetical protein
LVYNGVFSKVDVFTRQALTSVVKKTNHLLRLAVSRCALLIKELYMNQTISLCIFISFLTARAMEQKIKYIQPASASMATFQGEIRAVRNLFDLYTLTSWTYIDALYAGAAFGRADILTLLIERQPNFSDHQVYLNHALFLAVLNCPPEGCLFSHRTQSYRASTHREEYQKSIAILLAAGATPTKWLPVDACLVNKCSNREK